MSSVRRTALAILVVVVVMALGAWRNWPTHPTLEALVTRDLKQRVVRDPMELPDTVVHGGDVRSGHEDVARALFMYQVEYSQFPLAGVRATFSGDGFLLSLSPVFAASPLDRYNTELALVFLRGETFVETCTPQRIDSCVRTIAGDNAYFKRAYTELGEWKEGVPSQILVVVYGKRRAHTFQIT